MRRSLSLSLFFPCTRAARRPIDSALIANFCSGGSRVSLGDGGGVGGSRARRGSRGTAIQPASSEPPDRLRRSRRARPAWRRRRRRLRPPSLLRLRLPIGPWRHAEEESESPMAAQHAIWRERAKGHSGVCRCMDGTEWREEENKGASASAAPFHRLLAAPRRQELNAAGVEIGRGEWKMRITLPGTRFKFMRHCLANAAFWSGGRALQLDNVSDTVQAMACP